jgi:hypothetical protein
VRRHLNITPLRRKNRQAAQQCSEKNQPTHNITQPRDSRTQHPIKTRV